MKGWLCGLDIVGIPSIHGFYGYEKDHSLHPDLQELIISCQVKKLIYLTDADTLTVNWKKDKELSKRPEKFFMQLSNTSERVYSTYWIVLSVP